MNLTIHKKYHSFLALETYFGKYGANLGTVAPAILDNIATFTALMAPVEDLMMDMDEDTTGDTIGKNDFKAICQDGVWKLTLAMQCHYVLTNNEIAANNVKMTTSRFARLSEKSFYSFAQMVISDHQDGVFTPYGVVDAEVVELKAMMLEFPNRMRAIQEAKLKRKMAAKELDRIFTAIRLLLKTQVDNLVEMAKAKYPLERSMYRTHRRLGIVSPIAGKPQFEGNLAANDIKLLEKHPYRRKRAIFVTNTGTTHLLAGIGTTENAFTGTPFLIPPGKTMRRISQKLAEDGEFFLLQSMGEGDGKYEVWIKEGS